MDENVRCQRCGAQLVGQVLGDLCAACLLKLASDRPRPEGLSPVWDVEKGFSPELPGVTARHFADYELLEMIGRGGMGVVYKARQRNLNRLVALKMVLNWQNASLDTLARFNIEARAAAKLDHPNIVPTYQIGEVSGQPFFSMKLVDGASLGKRRLDFALAADVGKPTRSSDRVAQVRVTTLLAKVARAVHFAHEHGVIHRDLKPNNILIGSDGEPHLTDFGIAKLIEHDVGLTGTNDVLGTPAYMAPEQAAGRAITPAVDVYSLGAILYELLTGHPPFRGNSPLETLRKVVEEEPVPPTHISGAADKELAAISLKCLEKNPLHRYASALDLAEDLERWMRHEPILAKRATTAARAVRWARRNPVGASLIGTLCAGLVGALLLLNMVSAEKNKTAAVLQDVERAGQTNAQLLSLTVAMLHEQLEGLWLSNDRRVLQISSEQLAALSGLPITKVVNKSSIERLSFGLAANESPVSDSQKYALLLSHVEQRLSERRKRPVRIDLKIFKFKEDRLQALLTNGVTFARMGDIYFQQTRARHPGFNALVQAETRLKTAVFFTRTNTGILKLADLKGRSLAFGDAVSGITFWGQVKLAAAGVAGRDLKEYVCIDSRSEFIEEVHELGYDAALKRRGWLHSTADVIEDVINGRYDAGVTSSRGFERHKDRGLVKIVDSEFERSMSPWVGGKNLAPDIARDLIEVLVSLENEAFLLVVPGRPSGFTPVTEATFSKARAAMARIDGLFPILPAASGSIGRLPVNLPQD